MLAPLQKPFNNQNPVALPGSSNGLGALLSLALGAPMICMILDQNYSLFSLLRAKALIATDLKRIPAAFRRKGVSVSWGVNTDLFNTCIDKSEARKVMDIAHDQNVVAYTGSFRAWHGLDILVEAAAIRRDLKTVYLLIGDGPVRDLVRNQVAKQNLESQFIFTGAVPYEQVPNLLAAADLCVAPFNPELHSRSTILDYALDPLKVFEYLAMRIPVITISSPNMETLFTDGVHLRMVPPRDPRALAGAIDQLIGNKALARDIANSGYSRVISRHTWSSHVQHLISIFNGILKTP